MSIGARRIAIEEIRSLAAGGIGAAYAGIGTSFTHPVRILFLQNLTDSQLMFSDDGVTDKLTLPAGGFMMLDCTANKSKQSGLFFAEGTRFYAKEVVTPTTGSVYLTVFYGSSTY
jgi:hypothetical protein